MAMPYHRTLGSLDVDSPRRWMGGLIVASLLLVAWLGWAWGGRVGIYATTDEARIETSAGAYAVDVESSGRVTAVNMKVGQVVEAGEVLLEMDVEDSKLLLAEATAHEEALSRQISRLEDQRKAEQAAAAQFREARSSLLREAAARVRQAEVSLTQVEEEAKRAGQLHSSGLLPDADLESTENQVAERRWAVFAERAAEDRVRRTQEAETKKRVAELRVLEARISSVGGDLAAARSLVKHTSLDMARRSTRAPVAGVVAECEPLTPGKLVEAGRKIATIVPQGRLKVVANFEPAEAIGRIHPGQTAIVRVQGFPWVQFGVALARVTTVSLESRSDRARVELELVRGLAKGPPLAHGQPATVEIEIEKTSPADLLLRTMGHQMASSR